MKITASTCWVDRFSLRESYSVAHGKSITHCDNVFLTLETNEGLRGWGMAAPDSIITGEDVASVMEAFRSHIEPCLQGENPFYYSRLNEELRDKIPGQPSALAMVEIALFDLMAQKANVPLYMFLGGYRDKIVTSVTIGITDAPAVLKRANELTRQGIKALKIKGGLDVERDISIVLEVRKIVGEGIAISFDANQSYSLIEAAHFIRNTKQAHLELIEQPTSPDLTFQWHLLRQEGNIPIMADESLKKLSDTFTLTSRQAVDYLNIKLMKVGGITPALQINSSARSADVKSMIGGLDECSLGVAAGLHVALARPNFSHADLDSWLDIEDDPFSGLVILDNGYLLPNNLPGIGVNRKD